MNIIKLYEGRSSKPIFARLERVCTDPSHRFYKGLLIVYPLDAPELRHNARWVMPSEVRVEWIREFRLAGRQS